jgi:23S rRNA pseudouridine2605 synthase
VKVGDIMITTPATLLTTQGRHGGWQSGKGPEAARLYAFHKPSGLIAERDPAGRPTIYTALRNALPAARRA